MSTPANPVHRHPAKRDLLKVQRHGIQFWAEVYDVPATVYPVECRVVSRMGITARNSYLGEGCMISVDQHEILDLIPGD